MTGVYILDTETTSRNEDREVIELAWLKLETTHDLAGVPCIPQHIVVEDRYWMRYKPTKPIDFGAMAVHHILPEDLEGRPPASDAVAPEDCDYMIGHSIDFDWEALGRPDVKRICTRAMAEHVWQDADSYSQSALLYMILGPTPQTRHRLKEAHSAVCDCINNQTLLEKILSVRPDITTWQALWMFSEESRIPLRMPITAARGELLTDIEVGLLDWCLRQDWMPHDHPYLFEGLLRERRRRQEDADVRNADFDDDMPF